MMRTHHLEKRQAERGIDTAEMKRAVKRGSKQPGAAPGTVKHSFANVTVVTGAAGRGGGGQQAGIMAYRSAPRRHATKLWAVAVPYGNGGNWRSHRLSELSRSGEIPNSAAAEVVLRGGRATAVSADEALAQPLCRRGDRPAHARRPRDGPAIDQQSSGGASPSAPHACSFKLPLIPTFQPARETSRHSTAKSGDRSR